MIRLSLFVENIGLEPMTPCVQGRCSKPTELIPRYSSLDFRFQRQDIRLILSWFLVLDSNIFLGSPRQS